MKTKTITLYTFDELPTESAKIKAREWYQEGPETPSDCWEHIEEDAKNVGLEIQSLDQHRANKGRFKHGALETAHKIEKEHGSTCETFKTTVQFLADRDNIIESAERDEDGEFAHVDVVDEKLDELEGEYLHDILEDYRIMLEKEIEYQYSDEVTDENIRANEYTFRENGKRED